MASILERAAAPTGAATASAVRDFVVDGEPATYSTRPVVRPQVRGKFLWTGEDKFLIRGVTYGPFRPDSSGVQYRRAAAAASFVRMARHGINAIRTYTVPPAWLLDEAADSGIRVMIGVPWEQHVTFLDERRRASDIERRVRESVAACAGHPAVLAYAIGNEIPAPIVRWHGARRVERHLAQLCQAAKSADPDALVTYVNYPTTEYLQVPAADFLCLNVYLESQPVFSDYLARLQNLAGDRPLVMGELGLDSRRNGERAQSETLDWQVRTAFDAGCSGVFVFSWTDEWHRGGAEVEDWDFGLTRRDGTPKPALAAVSRAFAGAGQAALPRVPRVSVVACVYNGAATLQECVDHLARLRYRDYEVIIVDDGSTDGTHAIAQASGFRVIRTENRGLSSARNSGMRAATGEIIAYIDGDAYPDPDWLTHLARTFTTTAHVGVGGPNIAPPGDGFAADCVARSPGNPVHVLLSDRVAEHIPGCNFAVRREALQAIGGFDEQFRIAADDVDVCWRLQEAGGTLGFNPAAMVWHHCRATARAYWNQQRNYGRAEAMLERKWPEKYNSLGHLTWAGRMYGSGDDRLLSFGRWRIYHGVWGSALFQSIYERRPGRLRSLFLVPEWYLLIAALYLLIGLAHFWPTVWPVVIGLIATATATLLGQAFVHALRACAADATRPWPQYWKLVAGTTTLHLLQPLARLWGRYSYGLRPFRGRPVTGFTLPYPRRVALWSERWRSGEAWLQALETRIRRRHGAASRSGNFDRWDLRVQTGFSSMVYIFMAVEEHGNGKQLLRFRCVPRLVPSILAVLGILGTAAAAAALDHNRAGALLLSTAAILLGVRTFRECAAATAVVSGALEDLRSEGAS